MSVTPIRGKWDNIPAVLHEIASDNTVTGVMIFTTHLPEDGDGTGKMKFISIGTSREKMAFGSVWLAAEALIVEDGE